MTASNRCTTIDATIGLLAELGIRGTSLRKIGARTGVNYSRLADAFGGKDRLIAQAFRQVLNNDLARLRERIEEWRSMGRSDLPHYLWGRFEEAGGRRRVEHLAITELLLCAGEYPELAELLHGWLVERVEVLRAAAREIGINPLAVEVLSLTLITECGFAVSNYDSAGYRLIARETAAEAYARLTGSVPTNIAGLAALAARFHVFPNDQQSVRPSMPLDRSSSKDQIVEAAAEVFEKVGAAGVTHRLVAELAGVPLSLTAYYFGSVNDLALAGLLRSAANLAARFEVPALRQIMLAKRLRTASASGRDIRIYDGLLYLSLAAARSDANAHLGAIVRRQIGVLAYAAASQEREYGRVTRTSAASYAMWSCAAYLIARSLPDRDTPFDFVAHAQLAWHQLLGLN